MANPRLQELGVIGVSLLGIWLCVQALSLFAFFLPVLLSDDSQFFGWEQVFPSVVHALLGALLVLYRSEIAAYLFREDEAVGIATQPPLAESLLALLGVYFVVNSIAQAAQVEFSLFTEFALLSQAYQSGDRLSFLLSSQSWSQRAPYLVRLAIGIWLVLGAQGLVTLWLSFRRAGHDRGESAA